MSSDVAPHTFDECEYTDGHDEDGDHEIDLRLDFYYQPLNKQRVEVLMQT